MFGIKIDAVPKLWNSARKTVRNNIRPRYLNVIPVSFPDYCFANPTTNRKHIFTPVSTNLIRIYHNYSSRNLRHVEELFPLAGSQELLIFMHGRGRTSRVPSAVMKMYNPRTYMCTFAGGFNLPGIWMCERVILKCEPRAYVWDVRWVAQHARRRPLSRYIFIMGVFLPARSRSHGRHKIGSRRAASRC